MKNSHLTLFFGVLLILILPFQSQAQELAQSGGGIFSRIFSRVQSSLLVTILTFLAGMLAQKGWTLKIKKAARRGAIILKEMGELLTDTSTLFEQVDHSIRDDGTVIQNSIKEVIASGKHVIIEGKEVIVTFKPVPKT